MRVYASKRSPLGKACLDRNRYESMKIGLLGPLYDRFSFRQRDKELYVAWLRPFRRPNKLELFAEFNLKYPDRLLASAAGRIARQVWARGGMATELGKGDKVFVECASMSRPFGEKGVLLVGSNADPRLMLGNREPIKAPFIRHPSRTRRISQTPRHADA